jgi:hypothetical protein
MIYFFKLFFKNIKLKRKNNAMKNLLFILIVILTWIPLCWLNASILNVPGNYPTIQSAINAAVNGDTILVAPGTYYENVNFRGKGVLLASYYINNHDTSYISNTVINGSTPLYPDTASCVIMRMSSMSSASDTTAGLIGFTLTGGRGTVAVDTHYPGYFYREGGGVFIQYWSPRLKYNRIIGNHIEDTIHPDGGGGGIRCCDGHPLIENNVIQYNSGYCGTAICIYYASGTIRNNIITGNYGGSVWGSGAIYIYNNYQAYPSIIENNTVINNSAYNGCGGLRLYLSNDVAVKNNIIWGNTPTQLNISGGTFSIKYCDIQGGYSGTGNINLNPQFIGNTNYLSSTSPCIDAGDTSAGYKDPEDPIRPGFALLPALGTVRNDMGAFGGPHCTVIGSSVIGIKNSGINQKITDFNLYQNFPNPFNPITTIVFDIPKTSKVNLTIFDVNGRRVNKLIDNILSAGKYTINFDASLYSSGVYFYKMETKSFTKVMKMILLK